MTLIPTMMGYWTAARARLAPILMTPIPTMMGSRTGKIRIPWFQTGTVMEFRRR